MDPNTTYTLIVSQANADKSEEPPWYHVAVSFHTPAPEEIPKAD